MEFFEVLHKRHSVRQFTSQPIPEEFLQCILQAANQAPSAGNLQAYEIYVVKDSQKKDALAECALGQEFLSQAPVVLAFCTHARRSEVKYAHRGSTLYTIQDTTIACTFAMLAATACGLASVWVGAFDELAAHQILGAPAGVRPVALLPMGYPAEDPAERPRRRLEDLVHAV